MDACWGSFSEREAILCVTAEQSEHPHAQTLKFRTGAVRTKKGSSTLCFWAYLLQTLSGICYRSHPELSTDQCQRLGKHEGMAIGQATIDREKPTAHKPWKNTNGPSRGCSSLGVCLRLHPSKMLEGDRASANWNVIGVGGKVKSRGPDFCEVGRHGGVETHQEEEG